MTYSLLLKSLNLSGATLTGRRAAVFANVATAFSTSFRPARNRCRLTNDARRQDSCVVLSACSVNRTPWKTAEFTCRSSEVVWLPSISASKLIFDLAFSLVAQSNAETIAAQREPATEERRGVRQKWSRKTTVKISQQQQWPPRDSLPWWPQWFSSPNYVTLPQRDRSATMSADTKRWNWMLCSKTHVLNLTGL